MIILGVDPGCSGALALVEDGRLLEVVDMPILHITTGKGKRAVMDLQSLARLMDRWATMLVIGKAYVEDVASMPRDGAVGAFKFGFAAGAVNAAIACQFIPIEPVRPQVWKKAFGLKADKDASRQRAMREWPGQAELFARVKDDGRAEAALIALWGGRK